MGRIFLNTALVHSVERRTYHGRPEQHDDTHYTLLFTTSLEEIFTIIQGDYTEQELKHWRTEERRERDTYIAEGKLPDDVPIVSVYYHLTNHSLGSIRETERAQTWRGIDRLQGPPYIFDSREKPGEACTSALLDTMRSYIAQNHPRAAPIYWTMNGNTEHNDERTKRVNDFIENLDNLRKRLEEE